MSPRLGCLALLSLTACGPRITYVEPPKASVTVTPGLAVITWEKGLNAQSTLLARTTSNAEPTMPMGSPMKGDPLGTASVLFISEEQKFTDNQLPDACGPFAWHLWSRAADGTWSKTAATVRSLRGEHTLAPTAEVTQLASVFDNGQVRLTWMPPEASTAFEGVTVVRKRGMAPASSTDGTIVYSGPSGMVMDSVNNLSPTEPTFYAVFNCNSCGRCGATAPSVSVASPGDGGTSLSVSGLSAVISSDRQHVDLTWTTTAPRVRVLRTLNGMPSGPTDPNATVVFDGSASSARERLDALLPNMPLEARRYRYAAWGCLNTTCSVTPASLEFTVTLKQALQGGGYSLYFRHATATTCVDNLTLGTASGTSSPNWWKSCNATCASATSAQLTPSAADFELSSVATFFASNTIPVTRVASSEFCRAVRTAEGLQLDAGVIEQVQQLTYFVYEETNRCRDQSSLINAMPTQGSNAVFIGHADYATACPVFDSLNPADAVIYKPQLGAPPRYIGRVSPTQWSSLP
jgi:hypothetical protein